MNLTGIELVKVGEIAGGGESSSWLVGQSFLQDGTLAKFSILIFGRSFGIYMI